MIQTSVQMGAVFWTFETIWATVIISTLYACHISLRRTESCHLFAQPDSIHSDFFFMTAFRDSQLTVSNCSRLQPRPPMFDSPCSCTGRVKNRFACRRPKEKWMAILTSVVCFSPLIMRADCSSGRSWESAGRGTRCAKLICTACLARSSH